MMSVRPVLTVKILVLGVALCAMTSFPSVGAAAVTPAPAWNVEQLAVPSTLEPGSSAGHYGTAKESSPKLRLFAYNVGGAPFGDAVITDNLPIGLTSTPGLVPLWYAENPNTPEHIEEEGEEVNLSGPCNVAGQKVTCDIPFAVLPGHAVQVFIPLDVNAVEATTLSNEAVVEGSGGATVTRRIPTPVGQPDPEFGFSPVEEEGARAGAFDEAGGSPRAGTHPFVVEVTAKVKTKVFAAGTPYTEPRPVEALRGLNVALPSGVVVNPRATPVRCSRSDFELGEERCPAASQVGTVRYDLLQLFEGEAVPLYNLVPEPGVPAELGFAITGATITIRGGLSGDFRLTAGSSELLARYPIEGVRVQLWGVPSDSRHDNARRTEVPSEHCRRGCATRPDPAPFLTMPSACSPSMDFDVSATSWLGSTAARREVFRTVGGEPESVEGCEALGFSPSVALAPTTDAADSPAGLAFHLKVPQSEAPGGSATSTVKKVAVRLPAGMAINPPAANGLSACSPGQIGLGANSPAACPAASRVGSAEIITPLLESPLKGGIYLGEQRNNPFGTLLALYLAVEGEGIVVKLPGRVDVDAQTGQVTATFDNNPELPFEVLNVDLNSGSRAALVTPSRCGAYSARTELTPWSSSTPVVVQIPITVNQGCGSGGFSPKLEAGTSNPAAGRYSPFSLRVTREDGEQDLSRISATLPKGLLAKLAGVPLCPDAQTGSGDCPAASRVGTTTTGVGAGTQPLYIPQAGKSPTAIYLAGPYEGAPYSLVVRVPAQAGPFDLGLIAVRVALNVDPYTAQVTASSDPLPQILEGIPVAYRDVRVEVTRPEFVLNPTSCEPMKVTSSIASISGATASPSSRFQVAGCGSLAFKPKLSLSLKGPTQRGKNPTLKAVLTQPKGQANIGKVAVTLPRSEFIDNRHINNPCTRVQFNAGAGNGAECPANSILGFAKAWTPLLDKPLEGPVYFRSNGGDRELPDLVASLDGQVHLNVVGFIDSVGKKGSEVSRTRNSFAAVPDAPVSKFILELKGGKKGLLQNSDNLCKVNNVAFVKLDAQSGKSHSLRAPIANSCKSKKKKRDKRGS